MTFGLPGRYNLTDCRTGSLVPVTFVPLTRELAKTKIDPVWWAGLGASKDRREAEPDYHWRWAEIVARRQRGFSECWAVQTDDGDVQAAIAYRLDCKSVLDESGPTGVVYCERLAAAPRNRAGLPASPVYRGGGTGLLLRAMAHSYALGLGGRVSLSSLPVPATVEFYAGLGFIETGVKSDGMMVYEIQPGDAQLALAEAGWLT